MKREGASYFVTFRLADSLPKEVLLRLLSEKNENLRLLHLQEANGLTQAQATQPRDTAEAIERDYHRKVERYLDRGAGACPLGRSAVAALAKDALWHFHGAPYLLDDWVIMPNHVHWILWPMPNFTLSEIVKSRKQFIAKQANRLLGSVGETFWQAESFDHWIRNDDEKSRIRRYIRNNPVRAGLCACPQDWPWSSAGCGGKPPPL